MTKVIHIEVGFFEKESFRAMDRIPISERPRIMAEWPRPYVGFKASIEGCGGWPCEARDPRLRPGRFTDVVAKLQGIGKEEVELIMITNVTSRLVAHTEVTNGNLSIKGLREARQDCWSLLR